MRLGNRPERDPREAALADVYRGSMSGRSDPRRAALADLSDPVGEPSEDEYIHHRIPITPSGLHDGQVALPGSGRASIVDLESTGQLTPDLLLKGLPNRELPAYDHTPTFGPHTGPAAQRYMDEDARLERSDVEAGRGPEDVDPADTRRLAALYEAAQREAAAKGVPTPTLFGGTSKGSKRGLEWTGDPETLRLLQQQPHAEEQPRFEARMHSINGQQHQGLAVDRYANFERDTRRLPERDVSAMRARLFGEMLDEALAKDVGIEGARVDPLSTDDDSIEDLERARRNRALVGY